jgi:hypothetical protein
MRESPFPLLFFIGLIASLPTTSWSQTVQNNLNNAKQDMIILIMPKKHCLASTTSRNWWMQIPKDCIVRIPIFTEIDKKIVAWQDASVLSSRIPADYYKPSKYEFSFVQNGVYKIVPIVRRMEVPSWAKLTQTSDKILKSFESPEEKCGKIKNLPNSDPKKPPEVCFPE